MKYTGWALMGLLLAGAHDGGSLGAAEDGSMDVRRDAVVEAVEKVMPSVVNIATEEVLPVRDQLENLFREYFDPYYRQRPPNTQHSLGSGVIIDEEGYLLTNYHVVARARRIWVTLYDGREFEAEWISGTSFTDVALLKIKTEKGETFRAVEFAEDDDLMLGETVIALGNPFGLGGSVSRGILSSKSRRPQREGESMDLMDWLQTDAAINPGNSGGPLVNLEGDLIGLNVAVFREGQGIGFAIPVKRLAKAISEIYSPEWLHQLWFGARIRPGQIPLQVLSVQLESPAGKAGLKAGDKILEINGEAPESFMDFHRKLLAVKDPQEVRLKIERGQKEDTIKFRLVPEKTFFNEELIQGKIGASVQNLTPELARAFQLGRLQGLLVAGVEEGSAAGRAKLDRGMVITGVDRKPVSDVLEAAKILYAKVKGDKVILDVVLRRERGPFYTLEQVSVVLTLP